MKKYDGYALITGGSSGIGLALAHELAAQGYDLVLVARDLYALKTVANQIKEAHKVDVITISQDLSKPESTDIIFETLKKKKIHVGLLVNNAGYGTVGLFLDTDREKYLEMINIMCLSVTDLTYKFLPPMLEIGSGGVIIISSVGALSPGPMFAVYSSTKSYSLKLGISLHAEYDEKGIDFLTVCPGGVDTQFAKRAGIAHAEGLSRLTAEEIAKQTLAALGQKIVLVIPNKELSMRIGLALANILPYNTIEKIAVGIIKKRFPKES